VDYAQFLNTAGATFNILSTNVNFSGVANNFSNQGAIIKTSPGTTFSPRSTAAARSGLNKAPCVRLSTAPGAVRWSFPCVLCVLWFEKSLRV
jgi:hypothetical protein